MFEFFQLIHYSVLCWVTVKIFQKLFIALKTFVLPDLIGDLNFIEKFGSWAGSTDGIGKEFARELARRGLNVVLISRNVEKLQCTASEIENEFNVKTKFIVTDFCDGPAVYEHIKTQLENIPVAILVNNVGMTPPCPNYIDEMSAELCWHMMYVNIASAVMMTNLILPQMKKRKKGAIINISSASESKPLIFSGLYSSSKAFLSHFSHLLQYETAPYGITVQLLSPCFVKTNMTKVLPLINKTKNIFIPDAETYARHAMKTLGFSEYTSGYWIHGLFHWFGDTFPIDNICVQMTRLILTPMRTKHEKILKKDN